MTSVVPAPNLTTAPIARLGHSAKFYLPPRPPDVLRRQRLIDFLHENSHRKVILISAAAGYGKSTLLADFVHDVDYPIAWCRLDEADADVAVLAASLATALQQTFPAFQAIVHELSTQPATRPEQLAATLQRGIASIIAEYFLLVVDDFHLIGNSETVGRFFEALLARLPEQAHLLMAGRTIPPLPFTRLAARKQVAGISEEHLSFTPSEVQALTSLLNHHAVSQAEAEKVVADTEGWITGILLTTRLMWQGALAHLIQTRPREGALYDYWATEVLDQQPEDLREFLLESAVLPDMEPAVCDLVLGRSDSEHFLQLAETHRLFISVVGDEFRTYQYHHLFRDFLLARLRAQNPERLRTLQTRAAEWYLANGMAEAAVTFFIRASRLERAAEVAEANAKTLFAAGRHTTLKRWGEQLAALAHRTPTLYLNLAKADMDVGELARAEEELRLAEAGFAGQAELTARALETQIQGSLLLIRRGKLEQALAIAEAAAVQAHEKQWPDLEALALRYAGQCQLALKQPGAAEAAYTRADILLKQLRSRYDRALLLNDLANVYRVMGLTARAAQVQQEALSLLRELAVPDPLAIALNNISWDLHMLGQYEAALATYHEALNWARRGGAVRVELVILGGQADLFADLGDHQRAAELCRQALAKAEEVGDWSVIAHLYRLRARLDRAAGNFVSALEWLRRRMLSAQGHGEMALMNADGLRGIILVEMGHLDKGLQVLNQTCSDLEHSGALADLAQALFFRACAEFRGGQAEAAARSLTRAFDLAEQVGYDQMLVSEALSARDLLEACRHHPLNGPRVAALLRRAEALHAMRARLNATERLVVSPTQASATFTVRALGQSVVLKEGVEIPRAAWTAQRTRELFFFLVEHAPISRNKVLEAFWPNKPRARASSNLYQTLYRLKQALGAEVFVLEEQVCRMSPTASLEYDVEHFEAQAQAAFRLPHGDWRRLQALAVAVERYTGDYLADMPVDWAQERRQELSALHVEVRRAYADELIRLTRYADAREVITRALVIEPFRDDLHERLLHCLAGLGRQHEIIDHYRRYRDLLRAELGIDPSPALRALYARLIE